MKITVIATGKLKRGAYADLCETYTKRLQPFITTNIIEIPQAKAQTASQIMAKEAAAQMTAIPNNSKIIVLDEHGKHHTTRQFSQAIESYKNQGENLTFIIGGAEGLAPELKQQATEIWQLSNLTLPHQLARVLLLEQLYRAATLQANHPYHRD